MSGRHEDDSVSTVSPAHASTIVTSAAPSDESAETLKLGDASSLRGPVGQMAANLSAWRVSATTPGKPRFELGQRLGAGSQGIVYAARDRDCGREVALKTLHADRTDPQDFSRFIHEAQVTAQLEHPGIVPVHDVGALADGTLFYTMKRIAGSNLAEVLASGEAQRHDLLRLFVRICETMAFAHHHGVVHRDLKPRNVMIGTYGEVLVLDWGLAKVLGALGTDASGPNAQSNDGDQASDRSRAPHRPPTTVTTLRSATDAGVDQTLHGYAVGTPAYMSPEQARGAIDRVDRRSDVYALGVMLYELLVGTSPYVRGDVQRTLEQAADGRWTPIVERPAGRRLARRLVAIVHKAMSLEPRDRYDDAGALAADIAGFLSGTAVRAYRESPVESLARWLSNHRRQVMSTSAAAALTLACVLAWLWHEADLRNRALDEVRRAALAQEASGEFDLARRGFERLLDGRPADREAQAGLAHVVEALKRQADTDAERRAIADAERLRRDSVAAESAGAVPKAIAALHGAMALHPSAADGTDLERLVKRRDHEELEARHHMRQAEADSQLALVERAAAARDGREAQDHLARAKGLCPDHPDLERCERLADEAVRAEAAARADQLVASADASQAVAENLEAQLRALRERAGILRLEATETGSSSVRAELHRTEEELRERQDGRERALAEAIGFLHQALALAPARPAVRRALRDYFIARLLEAEISGHGAEAAAAEAQARSFDDGERGSLLAGEALVENAGERVLTLRRLSEQPDRTDAATGDAVVIPPGASARIARGRYLMSDPSGTSAACRLERGAQVRIVLPTAPAVPAGTVFIPGGSVYDPDGRATAQVASFAIGIHEVTCGEYLEFLNDPEVQRVYDQALGEGRLALAPRAAYDADQPLWHRKSALRGGAFELESTGRSERRLIGADTPVSGISHEDATAYAAWRAHRDSIPWRLPTRSEWQLAAQGGDGRAFPWGMHADPWLCHSSATVSASPSPAVGSFAMDRTVQGAMDMAGSLSEFVDGASAQNPRLKLLLGGNYHDLQPERYGCLSQREVDARWVHAGCGFRLAR